MCACVLFIVPLSTPEVTTSAVRMPEHQRQSTDDVSLSRDQDDAKTAGTTAAPLSLRLSTAVMTSRTDLMTSSMSVLSPGLSTLAPLGGLDAHRRRRTAFTSDQLLELEKEFHIARTADVTTVCYDVIEPLLMPP